MSETESPAKTVAAPARVPSMRARLGAEIVGTFLLVFSVIGTATFDAGFGKGLGVGFLGVAFALGLSVMVGAFAFGPVSGGHFNPAVTIGLAVAGRFPWKDVVPYIIAEIIGGAIGSTVLALIAAGGPNGFLAMAEKGGFASTGWGPLSPGGFPFISVLLVEVFTTGVFVFVILGATHERGAGPLAPIAIGITLVIVALIAIPVSNGSFNPARSIATAIYGGPTALGQLWLSIVAPILGAIIAGASFKGIFNSTKQA